MAPPNRGKGVLTLEKLATYDDVITDALVDKVGHDLRECGFMVASIQELG
jgi:hypothetical protein